MNRMTSPAWRSPCTLTAGAPAAAAPAPILQRSRRCPNGLRSAQRRICDAGDGAHGLDPARPHRADTGLSRRMRAGRFPPPFAPSGSPVAAHRDGFATAALTVQRRSHDASADRHRRGRQSPDRRCAGAGQRRRPALHPAQGPADRRAHLRHGRQDRQLRPTRGELRRLEHGRLGFPARHRPDLQVDSLLHRRERQLRRLRPVPRQYVAELVRLRPSGCRHDRDRRRRRADRLLRDCRARPFATSFAATPTSPARRRCRPSGRSATSSRATAT